MLYLTPEETAEILRLDIRTVYNLLRSKKLKAVKFGRSWRILRSTIVPNKP